MSLGKITKIKTENIQIKAGGSGSVSKFESNIKRGN